MNRINFWHDASKYGALLGAEEIVFLLIGITIPSMWFTLLNIIVFVALLYLFTRERVRRYGGGEEGYGYGQCFRFIVVISLFAGILTGVYEVFARNVFFTDIYRQALDQSMGILTQMRLPNTDMGTVREMTQQAMFSPLWILFGNVFAMLIKGGFFGLFVAAFVRRSPSPFASDEHSEK